MILLVVAIGTAATYFSKRQMKRQSTPPSLKTMNTTNYNKAAHNVDTLKNLDSEQAKAVLEKWKASDYIPTSQEFQLVQQAMKKS